MLIRQSKSYTIDLTKDEFDEIYLALTNQLRSAKNNLADGNPEIDLIKNMIATIEYQRHII